MELRCGGHLHFIQAIKGGVVTKVPNVAHGRPKLLFKDVKDIYDGFVFHNNEVKAERSCFEVIEERTVKIEPDVSACDANDGGDQRINNLDGDSFDDYTLKQIKECCQTRKRKHAQGLNSSKRKFKIEDSSSLEDCRKEQMAADDSDFMETLSSWKSKLSKNMKAKKKKCMKDPISTSTEEIMLVVKSEETQNGQEFPTSSEEILNGQEIPSYSEQIQNSHVIPSSGGHSTALVEVKSEVPEPDCFGRPYDYSVIKGKEEAGITYKWNLENELNYERQRCVDLIPLRIVRPSSMEIVISNSQLSGDQNSNFPAIEFESEESTIHSDHYFISPQVISLVEDCNSDIDDNQLDGDIDAPVSLPNVTTHKNLDYIDLDCRDDNTILDDCRKDEFTTGAEDQVKLSSTIEHGSNPDECLVCHSNYSPEYEKHSFASVNDDDEKKHLRETNDELTLDEQDGSSKLHRPERLLSTRKAISPSSQERLCKAMDSVDLNHRNYSKCRGKLYFTEQTTKKNGKAEELDDTARAQFTDNRNKISVNPRTFKRVSHPKGLSKIHSSRLATRQGCSTVQSCSKSAIAFTQQQMHDVECLAVKLTKELKSMKDIVDDMLRSEFCLNTSLRHKVNEARMAVKNATRAEEAAKRCLSFMARDCSRFCKIMKLADDVPPPQDVVRKERKKNCIC
ncbi:uncharacterized protein LOC113850882 [Abrus precatorius]|uniref:Uncharacterized protein LOC113850882 n=1 Tax=Abrus precatorius TaxID=3816 RepID=A0A8B8K2G3_ABRPR|nr:uncharacterized protein LOC113850882 [Abrus precatorius]